MINLHFLLVVGLSALAFLTIIVKLIIDNKLSEHESIGWFAIGLFTLIVSVFPSLLDGVSRFMGLHYSASLYFFFGIILILTILVRISCVLTKHKKQIKALSQQLSLLEHSLRSHDDK